MLVTTGEEEETGRVDLIKKSGMNNTEPEKLRYCKREEGQ